MKIFACCLPKVDSPKPQLKMPKKIPPLQKTMSDPTFRIDQAARNSLESKTTVVISRNSPSLCSISIESDTSELSSHEPIANCTILQFLRMPPQAYNRSQIVIPSGCESSRIDDKKVIRHWKMDGSPPELIIADETVDDD